MMRTRIAVLFLAVAIVAPGCRGGPQHQEQLTSSSSDNAQLEEFRRVELERQAEQLRRAREERRAARQVEIDDVGQRLERIEHELERIERELEGKLAEKGLEWNTRALEELRAFDAEFGDE